MRQIHYFAALAAVGLFISAAVVPSPAGAVGVGKTCDGFVGIKCNKGLFCDHKPGLCKGADVSGKCVKVSKICPSLYKPVCGCDNEDYPNDCERIKAGAQKKHDGKCKKPSRPYKKK